MKNYNIIGESLNNINCPKCGGSGHIDMYNHVDGGICFYCGGSGFVSADDEILKKDKIVKRNIKKGLMLEAEKQKQELHQQRLNNGYYKKLKAQEQAEVEKLEKLEFDKLTDDEKYKKSAQCGFDMYFKYLEE